MADSIVLKELYKNLIDYDLLTNQKDGLEKRIIAKLNELGVKGNNYNEVVMRIGFAKDKYADVFIKTEQLIKDRDRIIEELKIIEGVLKKARELIRDSSEIEYKVFVGKYLENLSLQDIATKEDYSLARIKQVSAEINKKISCQ